jgi:predicted small secreted protein|tara:strand:- start:95 stop:247 length:153 start_codon:yes stop_codon:yes gene_type:complete
MLKRKLSYFAIFSTILTLGFLGGCATVEGVGEDVQSAGEGIEEAAEEASN